MPAYNPAVVYGAWPYPAYPPYYYYPPYYPVGYFAATAPVSFGLGMLVGGAIWGNATGAAATSTSTSAPQQLQPQREPRQPGEPADGDRGSGARGDRGRGSTTPSTARAPSTATRPPSRSSIGAAPRGHRISRRLPRPRRAGRQDLGRGGGGQGGLARWFGRRRVARGTRADGWARPRRSGPIGPGRRATRRRGRRSSVRGRGPRPRVSVPPASAASRPGGSGCSSGGGSRGGGERRLGWRRGGGGGGGGGGGATMKTTDGVALAFVITVLGSALRRSRAEALHVPGRRGRRSRGPSPPPTERALVEILGRKGQLALVWSGDPVADRAAFQRFVDRLRPGAAARGGRGKGDVAGGDDEFPFPIPLVPDGPRWRWDTEAGEEELLNRRVGRNELSAIQVCLAYVDAQREYYERGTGSSTYAQRLDSTRASAMDSSGRRARRAGESARPARGQRPGRGLRAATAQRSDPVSRLPLRILTGQGPQAPGGAYDYVVPRPHDRRLRARRLPGELRGLRHHDVPRESGRRSCIRKISGGRLPR